jgi:hypothetical protein
MRVSNPAAFFTDALEPRRSLQLNNRYWNGERFTHLDLLREADDDVNNFRMVALRKNLKHVKALLPSQFHRAFLARLVYSMVFSTRFEPIRFKLNLPEAFIEANAYAGSEHQATIVARRTEDLRYIVDLAHSIYTDHYGRDVLASSFEVRYIRSTTEVVSRVTRYGEFSDYHFDEGKDFTCIIYLCDVSSENGCFSYINGMSGVRKSHLLRALHQVVGNHMGRSLPEETADLPLELRGSLGLGTFLDDAKCDLLRDSRMDFVGEAGDGIIFNGFDMLHRGGKPLRDQRTALFISTRGVVSSRLKKYAAQMLAYLWLA